MCEHVGPGSPDFRTWYGGDSKIIMELKEESIFRVKDEEYKKLVAENAELRRSLTALEEEVVEQAVHRVTQRFSSVNVTNTHADEFVVGNVVGVEDGQDHCPTVEGGIMVDASLVASAPMVDNIEMDGGSAMDGMNYFIHKVKGKVRKNLKLSGFEYPGLRRRGRIVNNEVSVSKSEGVGCSVDKIFTGFGITNRNTVWKMMTEREKNVISTAYDRYGDSTHYSCGNRNCNVICYHVCRAVLWIGRVDGNAVYFSDVRSLVIDAFAEVLSDEQERLNVGKDFPENSYFFSSICWDVMKGDNVEARFNYVTSNVHASKGALVYDTEDGSWKHYNSMQSRSGTGFFHFVIVMELHVIYSHWVRRDCLEKHCNRHSTASDGGKWLGSAGWYPVFNVCYYSMDCVIIVCAIIRQYVNHVDVGRSLEGGNCSVLRANMVKKFIGDPFLYQVLIVYVLWGANVGRKGCYIHATTFAYWGWFTMPVLIPTTCKYYTAEFT
ncbi:hypothetical protein CsSME_00006937 [Camellia sinensis var. sinensis]